MKPNWSLSLPRIWSNQWRETRWLVPTTISIRPAMAQASFSDGSTESMAGWKPNCRQAATMASSASFISDQEPLHAVQDPSSHKS